MPHHIFLRDWNRSILYLRGPWGEMVLVRKLFSGAVCGHTCSEVSSPRARQEVTLTAAAHTSSTPPSPELTSQFRQLLLWIQQGMGNRVTSAKRGLRFLSCSELFFLLWNRSTSDLLHLVQYLMADPQAALRGRVCSYFLSLLHGQETDVEWGCFGWNVSEGCFLF